MDIKTALQISRDEAIRLGKEALQIQSEGRYTTPAGRKVNISAMVQSSMARSVTYPPEETLESRAIGSFKPLIDVQNRTTLSAASELILQGGKPAVLNMASATSPGGGFLSGAKAQEEYLCRSSSLYYSIRQSSMYKRLDFRKNAFYDDYVIYSPNVVVFRADDGSLLEKPYECAFLTSPAVNANGVRKYVPKKMSDIKPVMHKRIIKLLAVAHKHGHESLVLGAWGCGAFGNDGQLISNIFKDILMNNFPGIFKQIIFAITDWSEESKYISPFIAAFST